MSSNSNTSAVPMRRRALSPVMVAWLLVLIIIGAVVAWLQLTYEDESPAPQEAVTMEAAPQEVLPEPVPAEAVPIEVAPEPEIPEPVVEEPLVEELPVEEPVAEDVPPAMPVMPATPVGTVVIEEAALIKAPLPALIEQTRDGPLPAIGPGNIQPWKAYARPYPTQKDRPQISIVISDIGLNRQNSERAISQLPGAVTLAFSPYGNNLQDIMDLSRRKGHESLLMVPTEPLDYPENDPGPHTLMANFSGPNNLKRLHYVMGRVTGYVGIVNDMGSKFTASSEAVGPILQELKDRGLMILDSRASRYSIAAIDARKMGVPRAVNNRYLDNKPTAEELQTRLSELETIARSYGAAVGIAHPYPLSISEISAWIKTLDAKGIELVPLTANANRQPVR